LSPNIDEIDEYVKLAEFLKLDNVSLLRFVKQGRGREKVVLLNNDEILHLFPLIEKYKDKPSIEFKAGCPLDFGFLYKKGRPATPCTSGISRCVIRPNGNVVPCPAFKDSAEFIAGNVNKDSLIDMWMRSPVFRKLRHFDHKKLRDMCATCHFLDICRGRCHAQRYHSNGNLLDGPDPYCPLRLSREQKTTRN
jgi:pyrroloquinoline quinone biosynthesis protein E